MPFNIIIVIRHPVRGPMISFARYKNLLNGKSAFQWQRLSEAKTTYKGHGIKHHIYFIINDNYRKLIPVSTISSAANQTLARDDVIVEHFCIVRKIFHS